MPLALSGMQHRISGRAFGAGLGLAALFYAGLAGFLWLKSPETVLKRSEKLASQTVTIERQALPETPAETTATEPDTEAAAPEEIPAPDTPPVAEAAVTEDPQSVALPPAPFPGLYEDTAEGRLPIIRATDKTTPFQAYRRPFTPPEGKKLISIVVMDVGLSDTASKAVMAELSPEVTVAVSPYAPAPETWLKQSRDHGHETWLKLPVEPDFYPLDDTGPQTLLINAVERQNLNKLNWAMARGSGYAGFVTGHQPAFMKSANDVRPVMHEIYRRGLGFADGEIAPSALAETMAAGMSAAYAHNDVWIDIPATSEHIAASLRQLELLAGDNGRAVGFIHSTPQGLKMLQSWIDGLGPKGFALAPLSAQTDPAFTPVAAQEAPAKAP